MAKVTSIHEDPLKQKVFNVWYYTKKGQRFDHYRMVVAPSYSVARSMVINSWPFSQVDFVHFYTEEECKSKKLPIE